MPDSNGLYFFIGNGRVSIDFVLIAACCLLGFVAHLLKKVIQYRLADPRFTMRQYFMAYPYHFILNICLTLGMALALHQIGQLNGVTAFFCGFASNSVVSIFRARLGSAHESVDGIKSKINSDPASDD